MSVNLGIWGKLTKLILILIGSALALGGTIWVIGWYVPLFQQNERMRQEILRLDTDIKTEEEISKQLKASTDALRNDPKAVERLARERLGYAKPGETVVRFEPPTTNAASAPAGQ